MTSEGATGCGPLIEGMGGRLLDLYFTFGGYDVVLLAELPDNIASLASDVAAFVPGHASKIKTTVLLIPEESVAVMTKASRVALRARGAEAPRPSAPAARKADALRFWRARHVVQTNLWHSRLLACLVEKPRDPLRVQGLPLLVGKDDVPRLHRSSLPRASCFSPGPQL